jgi:hypothetical protein
VTAPLLFRAGRALVVTLSALTLAHLLDLSHRLAYDTRLWAELTGPDALYRDVVSVGGPLGAATVVGVTVFALTVGCQRPAGRFALAAAMLHSAALGVWLGVLPADAVASDWERWRVGWETGQTVSFVLLLLGFAALVLAVVWERHPRPGPRLAAAGAAR